MKKLICLIMAAVCLLAGCAVKQEEQMPAETTEMQSLSDLVHAQQMQERPVEQPAEQPAAETENPETVLEEPVEEPEEEAGEKAEAELPEEEPDRCLCAVRAGILRRPCGRVSFSGGRADAGAVLPAVHSRRNRAVFQL